MGRDGIISLPCIDFTGIVEAEGNSSVAEFRNYFMELEMRNLILVGRLN